MLAKQAMPECKKNSPKNSAGWQDSVVGAVTKKSYCKCSEPEASSGLSLHVFSHFFHTFLPLCAASLWTIPRWREGQKQPEPSKNKPKTMVTPAQIEAPPPSPSPATPALFLTPPRHLPTPSPLLSFLS